MNHAPSRIHATRLTRCLLPLAALLLAGCPPMSVNPIAPPDATVQLADFEGKWQPAEPGSEPITVSPTRSRTYILTQKQKDGTEKYGQARLVKAGESTFIEVSDPKEAVDDYFGFCRIELTATDAKFFDWDITTLGAFESQPGIKLNGATTKPSLSSDAAQPLLDMPPEELHAVLKAHAKSFAKRLPGWTRVKP